MQRKHIIIHTINITKSFIQSNLYLMTIQSKQCAYNNNFNEIPLFFSISISVYLCAIFWMAILIKCRRRYFFSLSIEWAGKTKNNYNACYRLQFCSIRFIFVNCHFRFSFFAFVFGGWFQDNFFKMKKSTTTNAAAIVLLAH